MKDITSFTCIILAAGKGTRMKSPLPKVLHPVAGDPMILRTIRAVQNAGASEVRVVVGHQRQLVQQVVEPCGALCIPQDEQHGTAHAVKMALEPPTKGVVLILNGDHPLITERHIRKLLKDFAASNTGLGVVTCEVEEPGSFGRIVRHKGEVQAIVEAKDASQDTLNIKEVNTGIYIAEADILNEYVPQIKCFNAQNEFYLTDIVGLLRENEKPVSGLKADRAVSYGVNSQMELSQANKEVFKSKVEELQAEGVIVIDPDTTYIEEDVKIGAATVLYPGSYIRGKTQLGSYCVVEPNCFIVDAVIGDQVEIKAGSYIEKSKVDNKSVLGPYARLRPETTIGQECKIGNFVELKKVKFGNKSKASHLTYLGDADVGEDSNIGCGTITCNYREDKKKYHTKIGSGVFVGSDVQLVAPVEVGDGAVIGSGSTITKNVSADSLAVARGRQLEKKDWAKKLKK